MEKTAVYPGTFDPVTNGHLDIMERGLKIFDTLIVAVAHNPSKKPLFPVEKRVSLIKDATRGWKNITVESFGSLLADFVKKKGSKVVIKGLRAVSDFEFEFQMALMNRRLDRSIEALFLMPSEENSFISSRIIKEVAQLKGEISNLVPPAVAQALKERFIDCKNG